MSFPAQHVYTTAGIYSITVSAIDNHSNIFNNVAATSIIPNCGVIDGHVLLDNGNGIFEYLSNDISATGAPINVTTPINSNGGSESGYGYHITNIDHTQPSFRVELDSTWLANNGYTVIEPAAGFYDLATAMINDTNYNFLLSCGSTEGDLEIYAYVPQFPVWATSLTVHIPLNSFSCADIPADASLTLTFDTAISIVSSNATSYNISGNTFSTNLTGISGINNEITIEFAIPSFGPLYDFTINANTNSYTENNLLNNQFLLLDVGPYDPNHKTTNLASEIDVNVDEEIYYDIHFQNIGAGTADYVTIVDTIDAQLDLSTFRVITQSHNMSYSLDPISRKIVFSFPNINLLPQITSDPLSQGFVLYKIKENTGLPVGSEIKNTAHIFFDSNPAVVTNTTSNTNVINTAGIEDHTTSDNLSVYPTPANELIYIKGIEPQEISGIRIYDVNGKLVQTFKQGISIIPVNELSNGLYMMQIESENENIVRKICVQH
jgi:hypothetical protein